MDRRSSLKKLLSHQITCCIRVDIKVVMLSNEMNILLNKNLLIYIYDLKHQMYLNMSENIVFFKRNTNRIYIFKEKENNSNTRFSLFMYEKRKIF